MATAQIPQTLALPLPETCLLLQSGLGFLLTSIAVNVDFVVGSLGGVEIMRITALSFSIMRVASGKSTNRRDCEKARKTGEQ